MFLSESQTAGEPQLATAFFNMVRGWVVELRALVHTTQEVNKASMNQVTDNMTHANHVLYVYYKMYISLCYAQKMGHNLFCSIYSILLSCYVLPCPSLFLLSSSSLSELSHLFLFLWLSLSYWVSYTPNNSLSNAYSSTHVYYIFTQTNACRFKWLWNNLLSAYRSALAATRKSLSSTYCKNLKRK